MKKEYKKTIKIIVVLFLSFSICASILFYFSKNWIPAYIENKIDKELLLRGIQSKTKVHQIDFSKLSLSSTISDPIELEIPSLEVHWSFRDWPEEISLTIKKQENYESSKSKNSNIEIKNLHFLIKYTNKTFIPISANANIKTSTPIQSEIHISSEEIGEATTVEINATIAKQLIKNDLAPYTFNINEDFELIGTLRHTPQNTELSIQQKSLVLLNSSFDNKDVAIKISKTNAKLSKSDKILLHNFHSELGITYDSVFLENKIKGIDLQNFRIETQIPIDKNFLSKSKKQLKLEALQNPKGKINLNSKVKFKNASEFETETTGHFSIDRFEWFAVPFEKALYTGGFKCSKIIARDIACRPIDSAHKISINKVGEKQVINDFVLNTHFKNNIFSGETSASWLGASIESKNFVFSLNDSKQRFSSNMTVSQINLNELLKVLDMKSLNGTGVLKGSLNLTYESSVGFTIHPSKLSSVGKGKVFYKEPSTASVPKKITTLSEFNQLLARGQQALVYKALDNFSYEFLELEFMRSPLKGLEIKLRLKGANPDLANGQSFDINIPIIGDLESLIAESFFRTLAQNESSEDYVKKLRTLIKK